jgi:hypothetical protein
MRKMVDIYREQTESEKSLAQGGFIDIRKRAIDFEKLALLELDKKSFEYLNIKKKPYSRQLALREIKNQMEKFRNKFEDGQAFSDEKTIDLGINFDKFADPDLFEYLGESVVTETKMYDGVKQPVEVGVDRQYIRKNSQEKICIFFDQYDLKKMNKSNDATKKEKNKEN